MNMNHFLRIPEQHGNKEGGWIAGYFPRISKEGKDDSGVNFTEEVSPQLALKKSKVRRTKKKRGASCYREFQRHVWKLHVLGLGRNPV